MSAATNGDQESPEKQPKEESHPLAEAIDHYIHQARDTKFAARAFISAAEEMTIRGRKRIVEDLGEAEKLMDSQDPVHRAHGAKLAHSAIRNSDRYRYSDLPRIMEKSLFLSLFSAFDAFTGEVFTALHKCRPALFDKIERAIPLSEVLAASSIEDLKRSVLDREIEAFRRKSYAEQFDQLESWFGLPLKKFSKWPAFIEASQRRNLLTHCGGIVSEQYRTVCIKEGYPIEKLAAVGTRLELGPDYFMPACELMMEVALKLGQTLWRKVLPEEIKEADKHLLGVVYDALSIEQWARARSFGEFFVGQRALSSDLNRRLAVMNFAIALRNLDDEAELKRILSAHDWSASLPEFQLAEAVLLENIDDAINLMKAIGKEGQLLKEATYYTWPLFIKFRQTPAFLQTYEEIYGYQFVAKLRLEAEQERKALDDSTQGGPVEKHESAPGALEAPPPETVH
jgi:hypothetical protein